MARNLCRGYTGLIAILVPELSVPYFGELVPAADPRGCVVLEFEIVVPPWPRSGPVSALVAVEDRHALVRKSAWRLVVTRPVWI